MYQAFTGPVAVSAAPTPDLPVPARAHVAVVTEVVTVTQVQHMAQPTISHETFRDPSDPCQKGLPDALSFSETLRTSVLSSEIVLFSGGDSRERRTTGFGQISSEHLMAFAQHHGYNLVFLDTLEYEKSLTYGGASFSHHWHRTFALPQLRRLFPEAKYFVWMDDDILVPYPETDMLNHYINIMEVDLSMHILVGDDIHTQVLNSGLMFTRNTDFVFWFMEELKQVGLEDQARLSKQSFQEQSCMVILRQRHNFDRKIRVITHREDRYNFNTFVDVSQIQARTGDAFVHFVNLNADRRLEKMQAMIEEVFAWRSSLPAHCSFRVAAQ